MAQQQYSTPDGSIWVEWVDPVTSRVSFNRIASPDGSHEDDFRPQKISEVLRSWGPLSLYDPHAEELSWLKTVLRGIRWDTRVDVFGRRLQEEFRKHKLKLVKEEQ